MPGSAAQSSPASDQSCDYCALPVRRSPVELVIDGTAKRFCCYGCGLALQITDSRGEEGHAAAILVRLGLAIFFAMNVMMMSLPAYAPHVYGETVDSDGALFSVLRVLAMVFAAPVLVLLGGPILSSAVRNLRSGAFATDALIVLGVVAATAISAWRVFAGGGPVFFDTAVMVLVLVTLGRYLEARARARAGAAIRRQVSPDGVIAHRISGGAEDVEIDQLRPGDRVRVLPGEMFPTDGRVTDGSGWVDEAALTGESTPLLKRPSSLVSGGTCSLDGRFEVAVERAASDSATARIAGLLAEASRRPSPVERATERVARFFLPATLLIAAATALWWGVDRGIDDAVLRGLSVLVVACPCALGLATPLAMWLGLGAAASRGIVVRSAEALEHAAAVDAVYFDKTGTLTSSTPRLVACLPSEGSGLTASELLAHAALLEQGLNHPLARAIEKGALANLEVASTIAGRRAEDLRILPGRGVVGEIEGTTVTLGSPEFAAQSFPGQIAPTMTHGAVYLWTARGILGEIRFAEEIRPSAAILIDRLRRRRFPLRVLSGDRRADAISPQLVSRDEVELGLSADDKLEAVRAASRQRRHSGGALAMVGDGLNDAPALAAADLGIAFGAPSDLTRLNADAVVLADDLMRIDWLLDHAHRLRRVIRQNLVWAFGYNTIALVAAAAGWLTPMIASILMLLSSSFVIANSRKLRARSDPQRGERATVSDQPSYSAARAAPPA